MFLTFLAETNTTTQFPAVLSDAYDFTRGFVNGTNIMKAVPSLAACDPVTEKMTSSVHAFVATIQSITKDNYQEALINATAIGRDIYDEFAKALPKCLATINETDVFTHKVIAHMNETGYVAKIMSHATQNLIEVFQRVSRIQGHVSLAHHFDAGVESGSFFNFLFFHDFVLSPKFITFFTVKAKTTGYEDFATGFVNGTNVLAAIPSAASCNPDTNRTNQLADELVAAIGNITIENFMTQITVVVAAGKALINELATNVPTCMAAGKEAMTLVTKLSAHVNKSGYSEKVISHAMSNVFEMMSRFSRIQAFFTAAQHFSAGVESGSFFNFCFLHDFIL
jgi:alkylated DNA nucleotide flippase Atl1